MGERRVKVGRLTAFQDADDPLIDSPLTSPTAESAAPRSTAIVVDDESFVISRDDERYDKWTQLLRQWPDKDLPIYVEAEDEGEGEAESGAQTRTARKLVSPMFKRVLAVRAEPEDGWHRVVAEASPTFYFLSAQHPKHDKLLPLLRRAVETREFLFIFLDPEDGELDRQTILDVRPAAEDRAPPANGNGAGGSVEVVTAESIQVVAELGGAEVMRQHIEVVSHTVLAPMALRSVITEDEANTLFDDLLLHPALPFCYVNDCCTARSHLMTLIMRDMGIASHKVWNYGSGTLHNVDPGTWERTLVFVSPASETFNWLFHTAPVVKVDYGGSQIRERVIDPAVLPGPRSINNWRQRQGDPNSRIRFTPADIYWLNPLDPGPGFPHEPGEMERSLHGHRWKPSCRP